MSSTCNRTKQHIMEMGDKISTFTIECSNKLNQCTSWLCTRKNGTSDRQRTPSTEVHHGPNPSPAGSCGDDDSQPPPKNCYRLVMLGSARVGKTSLVARFLGGKFEDSYTPTIEDFHRKLYRIRGEVHQLDILDTSGHHPFPAMQRLSFLTGDIFVLVFSMDSRESFEEVTRLREQILETKLSATTNPIPGMGGGGGSSSARSKKVLPKVPMVIAGNKCDRDMRTVSIEEIEKYLNSQDTTSLAFVETSAKKNLHVDEVFYELFNVANLPLEMAPNHHKRVTAQFGSPCTLPPSSNPTTRTKKALSIKRRLSDACGVVAPNVRRPSIRTDLMIMKTKTSSLGDGSNSSATAFSFSKFAGRPTASCVIQ